MPTYNTEFLTPDGRLANRALTAFENLQAYNALDCCLTFEIDEEIERTHGGTEDERLKWSPIYDFERALQAPYLSIMRKGFRVNERGRSEAAQELRGRILSLENSLAQLAMPVWGKGLNPRSPAQLKEFLYSAM